MNSVIDSQFYTNLSVNNDDIKENTINELIDSGYEAYDVNSESYDEVQEALATDLEELSVDSEGSYIIVVSGEDSQLDNADASTMSTAGSSFNYTYNGNTYKMRYLTVTAADISTYGKATTVNLLKSKIVITNCLDTAIEAYISTLCRPLGTVASICGLSVSKFGTAEISTLNMNCGTNWTRIYTQVWDSKHKVWVSGSSVEYVSVKSYMSGLYYSASENEYVPVPTNSKSSKKYSTHQSDTSWRKKNAAIGYIHSCVYYDTVGDVSYYYGGSKKVTHKEGF